MSQLTRPQLVTLLNSKVLSGGNQTTALKLREFLNEMITSMIDIIDDKDVNGGYLGISSGGIVDVTKIAKLTPTGEFLKDNGTWSPAGISSVLTGYVSGAGTITAADTILQGIQKLNGNQALYLPLAGGTLTGNLNGVTPTEISYVSGATSNIQTQINNINTGLSWKIPVRAATTANITLSGAQTIDGVSVIAGDRVLVKNQSTTADNGIYVCAAGAWSRSSDATTGAQILSATMVVEEGSVNADVIYTCSADAPITIGVTSLPFIKTSATTYTGSNGITLTGNNFTLDNSYFSGAFTLSGGVATIANTYITSAMMANQTSAQIAGWVTDETGFSSGAVLVFSISPAFTGNPTVPTQSQNDNSTKIASTAYVDTGLNNLSMETDLATQVYHLYLTNR